MAAESSLNSFAFVLVSCVAIAACRLSGSRLIRELVVLLLSGYFVATFLTEARQALVLFGFLAVVYVIARLKASSKAIASAPVSFAIVAGFWAFLFLLKDPGLLPAINPFHAHPLKLTGISYIVFRGITFVLEIKEGERPGLLTFTNYMLFFPAFLAGPIERFENFEQTTAQPVPWDDATYDALNRVLNGFIKKFVIADNLTDLGIFAMMSQGASFSTPVLWLGVLSQLSLLLLDFSGYCDIVLGVAALMGYRLSENFNYPFAGKNLQEFWSRWHMSLSSVIQDYVFSPLSKVVITHVPRHLQTYGIASIYVLSMVLVAMWHGTTAGFLLFGLLNGVVLFAIQIRRERARAAWKAAGKKGPLPPDGPAAVWTGRIAVYMFVSVTMICWYSTIPETLKIYGRLLGRSS